MSGTCSNDWLICREINLQDISGLSAKDWEEILKNFSESDPVGSVYDIDVSEGLEEGPQCSRVTKNVSKILCSNH